MAWNCQGIGSTPTVRRLHELRSKHAPDIVFLMETKNIDDVVLGKFKNTLFSNHFLVSPEGLSGGLSLSWKDKIDLEILDSSPNYIDTKIITGPTPLFITFVYGAPRQEDRAAFWTKLMTLGEDRGNAWCLTGDFNDLLDNDEKEGGPRRWEGSFVAFRSFVTQTGLWDIPHTGNHLSWRGTRYNHAIQSRLDRAMGNCSWFETFPATFSEYLRFEGSDHRPLITYLDASSKKKRGLFRFDRRLATKPEVRSLVQEEWNPSISVLSRLNNIRQSLVEWTKTQNVKNKDSIHKAQRDLDTALSSLTPDPELIDILTTELDKAYAEEELYWRQRSRILWLQHGDRNSSFFHAVTRGRKAINSFSVIESESGETIHGEDRITDTISQFYQALFSSTGTGDPQVVTDALSPVIQPEDNEHLTSLPSDMEIKKQCLLSTATRPLVRMVSPQPSTKPFGTL